MKATIEKYVDKTRDWKRDLNQILDLNVEYLEEIEHIKILCDSGKNLILFGAGATSDYIVERFRSYGIEPFCFCDNATKKIGMAWGGVECFPLQEVFRKQNNTYVYITTQLYYSEIREQLLKFGIQENEISKYDVIPQFEWEIGIADSLRQEKDELLDLMKSFSDDASREVLLDRVAFLITRKRDYAVHARSIGDGTQYFDDTVQTDWSGIRSMVDCGAYIGDSALALLKKTRESIHIYELEPDPELMKKTRESLRDVPNVVYIKKATSDRAGRMKVSSSLGVMQSIVDGGLFLGEDADEEAFFDVCILDEELRDRETPIGLIKMDIEGAELETLRGAKELIRSDHPMLAVCIYHRKEDLLSIPLWIKSVWQYYRFFLRHYSDNQTETVLYALP